MQLHSFILEVVLLVQNCITVFNLGMYKGNFVGGDPRFSTPIYETLVVL